MLSLPMRLVTYSPAFTLVPTYECFNRCTYCNFRADPHQSPWLSLTAAEAALRPLQAQGVIEVLILSGEVHPQDARRGAWLQRIYDLCELALSLGFLPHTNAGPLSRSEMAQLKSVNVSMGLMLEQVTPRLLKTVHRHAPSKRPELRLAQLIQAGELGIPFTTGLLLGLGETRAERRESLQAIAEVQRQWGHIQEVIFQPHTVGSSQSWAGASLAPTELCEVIAEAREVLPPEVVLQVPPNLVVSDEHLLRCLDLGARDLGGIGPLDHVNPDYPHPLDRQLAATLAAADWQLVPRLPIYAQYDSWLTGDLAKAVADWRSRLHSLSLANVSLGA
ncbi:7,8-didemethyl-8-hydroxy-5-deazariboflavin synthase subunit CofG [Leptolyngbya sp. FACHB-261]|uniref:7,8-didemethyl-8-hydroxy-5-deazariboflavin synthase subunit CofG n=1 Tax=Leptolyngbya sp. FACHB-261 TaxID=2692806 RepID=UPI0016845FDD|nr:7,8-didemethyl-8-hydroxy-5-deazariboflavin synthase subunit CofG [Leptolyngbya sp. FACHB-261]MBD2100732.1 7,8-didemethyl-8-hydroxy-5-deazariboflavin synthase subunit CofG [Leptolyngbya sp. FACHB-261]